MGKLKEKNPNMMGIIQSIMFWLACCLGSGEGVVVIFCCTQVEAATSSGMMNSAVPGLPPRSIPRKLLFRGAAECTGTKPIQE